MITSQKISEIVFKIASNHNPEQIILFGSYAAGNPNEDSDLDLIVIKNSNLTRQHRSSEIRKSLLGSLVPIDILVYTKKEFDEEKMLKYSFISNAIKNSKVLYERNS